MLVPTITLVAVPGGACLSRLIGWPAPAPFPRVAWPNAHQAVVAAWLCTCTLCARGRACVCVTLVVVMHRYVSVSSTFSGAISADSPGNSPRPGTVFLSILGSAQMPDLIVPPGATFEHLVFRDASGGVAASAVAGAVRVGVGAVLGLKHDLVVTGGFNISDAAALRCAPVGDGSLPLEVTVTGGLLLGVGSAIVGTHRGVTVRADAMSLRHSAHVSAPAVELSLAHQLELREEGVRIVGETRVAVAAPSMVVGQLAVVEATTTTTGRVEMAIAGDLLVRGMIRAASVDIEAGRLTMDFDDAAVTTEGMSRSNVGKATTDIGSSHAGYAFGNILSPYVPLSCSKSLRCCCCSCRC